jgi:stalled ribosome rescue protein Dom34
MMQASNKTQQMIDEVAKYLKDNPKHIVYTNSQFLKEAILKIIPAANVEILKTWLFGE